MKEGDEVTIDPTPFESSQSFLGTAKVEGRTYPFQIIQVAQNSPKHTELIVEIDYEFLSEESEREIEDIIRYHIAQHDIW